MNTDSNCPAFNAQHQLHSVPSIYSKHYLTDKFKILMSIAMILAFMPSFMRVGDSKASLTYIYLIICFMLLCLTILKDNSMLSFFHYQALNNKLLFSCILALYLLHLIRFTISPDEHFASRSMIALIIFTTSYLYFSFLFCTEKGLFDFFFRIICVGLLMNFAVIILQKKGFFLSSSYYAGDDRYSGLFSHPNQLAIFISTTFIFFVSTLTAQAGIVKKTLSLFMIATAFVMLIMAGSKTNVLVALVVLVAFFSLPATKKNIATLLVGIVFLAMALFIIRDSEALLSINPRLIEVLTNLSFDNFQEYRTVASRIALWNYSWDVGTSYPYLGEGFKSGLIGGAPHSHNIVIDYLRIFGPSGMIIIVSFLLSLVIYRKTIARTHLEKKRTQVCVLSIYAYILSNMMSDSMGPQTVFFLSFFVAYLHSANPVRLRT